MEKKKIFLLTFFISAFALFANAQNAYETTEKWDKTNAPCVAVKVNSSVNDALKTLDTLLKNEGLKGKKSRRTLVYEKTVFPTISTEYINLYAKAVLLNKDKKNPITAVYVFVSKGIGSDYVSSSTDALLVSNLKTFLDEKYTQEIFKSFIATKVDAKSKQIKDASSAISALEKNIKKRTKDVEKAQKEIDKANLDIDKAKRDIEVQQNLLKQLETELKEIK